MDSAGSTFGNAGLNINYVDGNGATHTSAGHGSSGLSINAGSITAVQPGTGTSNTNAAASETWHSVPSILSGWSGTPRYKKQADNTVHLGGLVVAPGSGTVPGVTLWTMGTGYIPTAERYMPVVVFGTNSNFGGWLSIDTSGNVQLGGVGALNGYTFIFDGCRYPYRLRNNMTNFTIPFSLTPNGTVQTTSNPNQIANDRVEALIGTYPGERVMQSKYGVDVPSYVFAPDLVTTQAVLINQIQQALATWEPEIILDSVTPVTTQSDVGIIDVNVEFTLSNDPSLTPYQTCTVEVGGNIVSN